MDKNLANYLFHNETLYHDSDSVILKNELAKKETVLISEKPQVLVKSASVQAPAAVKIEEALQALEEEAPYKMNTNHLVVVAQISAIEQAFLVKVLMALDMSLAKVDLLDTYKVSSPDFKEIIYNNAVKSILYLGEETGGDFLPKLKLQLYQVKDIKQIRFMQADNLKDISLNEQNEKRKLWEGLKNLYN
jgi:hypothetical protein